MTESQRQFILDTLLPYKKDPSTCGFEEGSCKYLTSDGKMCAVGKHLKEPGKVEEEISAEKLFETYSDSILTDEARAQNLSPTIWKAIQNYHDSIALDCKINYASLLEDKTGLKFPELYP